MKHANSIALSAGLVFLTLIACGQNKPIPENLNGVKETVTKLDSAVTAMYGWEPRDSTYNHSLDTLVAGMMNEYKADDPEYEHQDEGVPAIQQQAYDEARVTWAEFKRLIDADKYEEALEFYLGEGDDYIKKNSGDFLVFLKHSTQRYVFFSDVLRRLMQEYKGDDEALDDYINNLQLEKALEDASIEMQADNTGYVPEVYPYVIRDLGMGLVVTGKMNEAQEMFSDMVNGVYSLTGDALYANFVGTQYAAQLYILDSKPDWALATWDNFKDYLKENESDYDPFNLIDELNVYENIELPLRYLNMSAKEREQKVTGIMGRMNISHRAGHFPQQLSGGQQQRVAIARAVVADPKLILADEPTGNLDSKNGKEVMDLLKELNQEGTTIVMVTHSQKDAACAQRTIDLFDGQIVSDVKNEL